MGADVRRMTDMTGNIIKAAFNGLYFDIRGILWQYDYGQLLEVRGLDLPYAVEVHFSQFGAKATTKIGQTEDHVTTVEIPSAMLRNAKPIDVYVFLHVDETDGETEYHFVLPVKRRPDYNDVDPTPEQTTLIGELIDTMNDAVEAAEGAAQNAAASETNAGRSENNAAGSAEAAARSAEAAAASERNAGDSESSAGRSAEAAARSAEAAATSENNAEGYAERAEQAANTLGYLEMNIDENGHLIYSKTPMVDVDFELDDGHLIMEV